MYIEVHSDAHVGDGPTQSFHTASTTGSSFQRDRVRFSGQTWTGSSRASDFPPSAPLPVPAQQVQETPGSGSDSSLPLETPSDLFSTVQEPAVFIMPTVHYNAPRSHVTTQSPAELTKIPVLNSQLFFAHTVLLGCEGL